MASNGKNGHDPVCQECRCEADYLVKCQNKMVCPPCAATLAAKAQDQQHEREERKRKAWWAR